MLYALKIATRYLTANKAQTALLVSGVAVGVFIFIFMSALIGGLAEFILSRTVGDISHITIEAETADPAVLISPEGHVLVVAERGRTRGESGRGRHLVATDRGRSWRARRLTADHGSRVSHPRRAGFAGQRDRGRAGARIRDPRPAGYMVAGDVRLGSGLIVLGRDLADDLALSVGQTLRLQSSNGVTSTLTLSGIFKTGNGGMDGARAFVSLSTARTLFSMPQGVTRIEIKLDDLNAADATAQRIRALTGLDAVPWTDGAEQLMEALNAQAQTGYFLKTFALITIVIGVASALLLSTYRRRPEIGIMRAMGQDAGL
jgi:lipoprotein-releasing system permease protein